MRPVARKFKRHFGATAKHVAVHTKQPWYWRLFMAALLVLVGYMIAYAELSGGDFGNLSDRLQMLEQQNQDLQGRLVRSDRQLQVEVAAQNNLAKELAKLQDEDMRLKEDVAFYQNILNESKSPSELKLQSFKLSNSNTGGQYVYQILLMQTGRQEKAVQGTLKLVLSAVQDGKPLQVLLSDDATATQALKVNFKYYQRLEGTFTVPEGLVPQMAEATFYELGSSQPKLSLRAKFPE